MPMVEQRDERETGVRGAKTAPRSRHSTVPICAHVADMRFVSQSSSTLKLTLKTMYTMNHTAAEPPAAAHTWRSKARHQSRRAGGQL